MSWPARPCRIGATAIVTGASSGLGHAFAERLADLGFAVIAVSRRTMDVTGLPGAGHRHLSADLATECGASQIAALFTTEDSPEVFVHAAGSGLALGLPDAELRDELHMLDLNVRSTLIIGQAALRAMLARNQGLIVTIASTAGLWSGGTYSASKAWTLRFTEGISHRAAGTGVSAVCVAPGFVRTAFFDRAGIAVPQRGPLWLAPSAVVDSTLAAAIRGRSFVIPSIRYRALVSAASLLPPQSRRRLVGRISKRAGIAD